MIATRSGNLGSEIWDHRLRHNTGNAEIACLASSEKQSQGSKEGSIRVWRHRSQSNQRHRPQSFRTAL